MKSYRHLLCLIGITLLLSGCHNDKINNSQTISLRTLASLPAPRPLFLAKMSGNLYAGTADIQYPNLLTNLWQYDFTTNSWKAEKEFPGKLTGYLSSFTVNEKLYIGFSYTGSFNQYANNREEYSANFYEYDPATNNWKIIVQPSNRIGTEATSFTHQNKGLVLWGIYRTLSSLVTKINGDGMFYDADRGFGNVSLTISGTPTFPTIPNNDFQNQRSDFEVIRVNGFGFSLNNRVYTGGGLTYSNSVYDPINDTKIQNDVIANEIYEFESADNSNGLNLKITNKFRTPSAEFNLTSAHQAFSLKGKGYIVTSNGQVINFDPITNQWEKVDTLSNTVLLGTDLNAKAYFINKTNQLLEFTPK